ncbi:lithostathine-like [Sorex fumeus]|uniref:lithostathine-like n=1 Tax=Sorex fumeus TaxID=62283 RepID=UPI0024ADDC63|nr:lithostathine-like [Sorex fumeus]
MLPTMTFSSISWIMLSCLIPLSQTQGVDFEKGLPSAKIICPMDSVLYYSYCYTLFMKPTTWMDANIVCQKRPSGSLASVLSKSEASFVGSVVRNNLDNNSDVWIGLHDPTEGLRPYGSGWEWSSTDLMNYNAWEINPPIPYSGYCGSVTKNSDFLKWKDNNCDAKLPYVCKFKY